MFSGKHRKLIRRGRRLTAALAVVSLAMSACGPTGPSSKAELCGAYRGFQREATAWHPISDSGVFRSLRDLGDVATRYQGNASVREAGPELKRMGSSDSFSLMEAQMAAAPIGMECMLTSTP